VGRATGCSGAMRDLVEFANELDRLITEGHQDDSLVSAVLKKFPDATQAEIDAGLHEIIADRALRMKSRK
jgi:hypothetical protein